MKRLVLILLGILCVLPLRAQEYVFSLYGPDRGVPRGIVTDIVQDHRGFVWVALAHGGVRRLDGRSAMMLRSPFLPFSREVFALATDGAGTLFVGGNAGVAAVRLGRHAEDSVDHALSERLRDVPGPVRRLEMSAPRTLYIESGEGSWELQLGDSTLTRTRARPPKYAALAGQLPAYVLRDVATDCRKRSWLATDRGLLLRDETRSWLFDTSNGLPETDVHCVMVDREANVWCGTSRGVYLHVPGRVTNFGIGTSLPEDFSSIHCVLETHDRSIWMGGDGGLLRLFDGEPLRLTQADGLPSDVVRCLLELPSGDLLIGTDNGLIVWTEEGFEEAPPPLTPEQPRITAMLQAKDRSYWIATHAGLLHWDGQEQHVYTTANGLPSSDILTMTEDAFGLIWVGTQAGLVRVSPKSGMETVMRETLQDMPIRALYADDKDRLWIGTEGAGVYVHSGRRTMQLTRDDGLAGNSIGCIIADNHGSLYFAAGGGVSVLPRANVQYLMPVDSADIYRNGMLFAHLPFLRATAMHTLGVGTDFLSQEFARSSVLRDRSGRLWFAGAEGVTCYNPPRPMNYGRWQPPLCRPVLQDNDPAVNYRIILADLCVNDTCTAERTAVSLGVADHVLRARLLLPTFRNRGDVRYLYQLQGMEYSWHVSRDGEILYTGLKPGSYTLVVQAALGEGAWTKRSRLLEVEVAAPFYESLWFWLVLILIAGLLGYAVQRQRYAWLLERERRRQARDSGDMFYNPN